MENSIPKYVMLPVVNGTVGGGCGMRALGRYWQDSKFIPVYCIIRDVEVCVDDFASSCIDLFGFCRNRSTSSTYKLILCVMLLVWMPVMLLFLRIAVANGSTESANSEGESGHPCLVLL